MHRSIRLFTNAEDRSVRLMSAHRSADATVAVIPILVLFFVGQCFIAEVLKIGAVDS